MKTDLLKVVVFVCVIEVEREGLGSIREEPKDSSKRSKDLRKGCLQRFYGQRYMEQRRLDAHA